MSSRLERHKKRRNIRNSITVSENVEKDLVDTFLNSSLDKSKIDSTFEFTHNFYDMRVSSSEVKDFLLSFKKQFNAERFNQLITDCKKEVIKSIVTPFGIGHIVAAYDKTGGNVDTIHNVRNGIYATDEEKEIYESRGNYNSDDYHKDSDYIKINSQYSQQKKSDGIEDYMTGDTIKNNKKYDLDHVVSAKEIHDDAGRILAEIDGTKLANTDTNLKPTDKSINRSKKTDDMDTFLAKKDERIKKIEVLKSKKVLTESEQKELQKLNKLKKIDDKKAKNADEQARNKINSTINKTYYTSKKFVKNVAKTGANEGAKMGMQQALGLIITEFFTAVFDEILDIYKNGFSNGFEDDRFFNVLKDRLQRITKRMQDKWKDVAIAFKDGFLSGFLSNLATTIINAFVTTGKRVVRIIREGLFSLFRAVKMILFPPENMSFEEAMHEAKKLIATGLIISVGVIVEEWIDTLIKGTAILEPFSDVLTTIFVGAITGLSITMVVYYIDKKKNDKELFNALVCDTNKKFDELDRILNYNVIRT